MVLGGDGESHIHSGRDRCNPTYRGCGTLACSKSEVVRKAIGEFHGRLERLSENERRSKLKAFDELLPLIPYRTAEEVDAEVKVVRAARRSGGRIAGSLAPA